MKKNSDYGMAIGNLTSQAGSNLNLNEFDHFVVECLKLTNYVRYVDDIVVISNNKEELENALPKIIDKLKETHQVVNLKKTKIDTAYHGVPFLGKVTYPYRGYQIPSKQVYIRMMQKTKNFSYSDIDNLIAKTNSQIGFLKNYNCRKVIFTYANNVIKKSNNMIKFDEENMKFKKA